MDKPAFESSNWSGWPLRGEVSGEDFRPGWTQGVGWGWGGLVFWGVGCRFLILQRVVPHSSEAPPCTQDPYQHPLALRDPKATLP